MRNSKIPDNYENEISEVRSMLLEAVAETDENLLNKF